MKIKQLFAALLLMTAAVATAQAPQMPPVPVDPEVRMGTLPNGLTYYVRQNNYPEHRVNFYIAQRVGSVQEEESQRGLAHFLEHMAFNGTENYPGNGVIDYTRTLGVEFGGDLNAYTSTDQTVYNINDVPSARQSALDSCLLILRDWSCGLLLEDNEIDKERGVIHEEWRLRSSPSMRILERNLETLFPDSKYGKRMPIGLMSVVDNFKYNELRDYYHKWYHPENQCIVVVGDIDVDHVEAQIKALFGPIKASANAAHVVPEAVPDNEQVIIVTDKDPEQQFSIVEILFKHDPDSREDKQSILYLVSDYMIDIVSSMLNQRLSEISKEPDCPFLQAVTYYGGYIMTEEKDAFLFYILPKEGQTDAATQAVMVEALRAFKHGFTATEYLRARDEYLSQLEKQYNNRSTISNEHYGRSYVENYLTGEPIPSIEQRYQLMSQIAPNIPVDVINQVVPELIPAETDKNLVILNMNREVEGAVYPTIEGFVADIAAARAADIQPYVDNVKNEPLMSVLPKPGKIKSEKHDANFDCDILTLSNGVKVVLKKTDFKDNEIVMLAESKGGSSLYGEADWANTEMFDDVIESSGLGNFDNSELEKALAGKQVSADLKLASAHERLNGKSTIKDLETMFQLTYLKFTNIKKDEKAFNSLMTQYETVLKNRGLMPEAAFSDSAKVTLGNHSWRERPFEADDIAKVNYDRVLQMAKERTANAADYTFYFVGSFDNDSIRKYLCQYIATLPAKGKVENWVNVAERPTGKVVCDFTRAMETPKAFALMYWYTDKSPYTVENNVLADVAGQVLDKVYLQKIREDAGAAYSASASGSVQYEGDKVFTQMFGVVPMNPEKSETALSIMREEMSALGQQVDEGTLKDIKEALIKNHDTSARENGYWLGVLSMWQERNIDKFHGYKDIVNGVTTDKVQAFVRDVILPSGNAVEVVMLPESTKE